MNKKFDCVKLKIELQEKLYQKINPKNIDDYFEKLKISVEKNMLYNELKKQYEQNKLILK